MWPRRNLRRQRYEGYPSRCYGSTPSAQSAPPGAFDLRQHFHGTLEGGGGRGAQTPTDRLTTAQVNERVSAFLVANKAALRINDAATAKPA